MSFRSAGYGAFPRTDGRGTSSPRSSHSHCSIASFSFSLAKAKLEVMLVVYQRVLERNYFYSFLCLTKIALLFRCLNMHLRTITLAHCGTLAREKLGNLRGIHMPEKDAYHQPFRRQAFLLSFRPIRNFAP